MFGRLAPIPPHLAAALAQDALILKVASAYNALPYELAQRLESALAGDHNIAQAYETAQALVTECPTDVLVRVLARLLVTTDDAAGAPLPLQHPANNPNPLLKGRAEMAQRRRRTDQAGG